MNRIACMGGFCAVRDRCARYHDTTAPSISERQCLKGRESPAPLVRIQWLRARITASTQEIPQ